MPVIEELPPRLRQILSEALDANAVEIAVSTDLDRNGRFGEEWFVLSRGRIRVLSPDQAGDWTERLQLPVDRVRSFYTDILIGGGALIAVSGPEPAEILRFSNALQQKFGRIVKFLQETAEYRIKTEKGDKPAKEPVLEPDPAAQKRCAKCGLLLPEGTSVCPACVDKGKVLLRIAGYLKPYWRRTVLIWTLMLLGMAVSLVSPYLTKPLVDTVLAPQGAGIPVDKRIDLLGLLVLALLAAQLTGLVINVARGRLLVTLGTRLSHNLRVQLYSHLQFLSLRFFEKKPVGVMISRVTQDTESLESVLVDGAQNLVVNVLTLLGIGTVLFVMNWRLTLLVLVPVPFVILLSRFFWKRIMSLWHRYWHYRGKLSGAVSDTLAGARVVKAFAKESAEIGRFGGHSNNLLTAAMSAEQTWTTLFPMLWFLVSTGSLLVWYAGGRMVIGGGMTLGTLMTFIAYLGMFYGPLQFLSRIADYLSRSITSAERVFEILDSRPETADAPDAVPLPSIEGRIEFRDVTFGYLKHKPVIRNLALDVKPGEMIGLVGKSGAGKSTTINLICRFYDVDEGAILVDGVELKKIRQQDLRSQIGIVLQDTFLFNGPILENIRYARPEASLEDVIAAARAANAHDFIVNKPDGYDTVVGERGQSLSGGERQRIAIARAILHDPRILILDEATAAVDTDTEKQIQDAIGRLVKGRTTFAIAHRLSTLRNADRLVVLKDGAVVEMGTHEELLSRKGEFHRLVEMQKNMSTIVGVGK
jgi:ATP-binding cassette subfamily B protein